MSPYSSGVNGANDPAYPLSRRAVLGGLASTPLLGAVPGHVGGRQQAQTYSVVQGDRCFPITPLRGDETVEQLYELHVPKRFTGDNGAIEGGTGPYYESLGTIDLQRPDTTISFLYEGPDGLSFVVVHDHVADDGPDGTGGSVTWTVTGLPSAGSWAVKDSLLIDPETGGLATVELDQWDVSGATHTIDWTWGRGSTDGGAFKGLGGEFSFTISPAFNEAAALWGIKNHGRITDWQFLSWSGGELTRHSVALDRAVTVQSGGCDGRHENVGGSEGSDGDGGSEEGSSGSDENAERSGEEENGDEKADERDDDDEDDEDDDHDEEELDDEDDEEDDDDDDDDDDEEEEEEDDEDEDDDDEEDEEDDDDDEDD